MVIKNVASADSRCLIMNFRGIQLKVVPI